MAGEVNIAKESRVNPINAQGKSSRAELPEYDHRYENPRYGDTLAVFVRRSVWDGGTTSVRFQARRSDGGGDLSVDVPNGKMEKFVQSVSKKKDYTIKVPQRGDYESINMKYNSANDEVTIERMPKNRNWNILTRRISANAFRNMKTRR